VFEDTKTADIVYNLDTEEGVAAMTKDGITMKEGCGFKFKLGFRVNHEILTGLKFSNCVMKGVFWKTEDLVIGSFAPQTKPYEFEFPRYGYNYAPSGMMYRGTYKSKNTFSDSDGNKHLEFDYKANIVR
jgi:Rho GDP-dissociation inhibitor